MKTLLRISFVVVALMVVLASAPIATAATRTWAGGTGTSLNWTTSSNWGGTAPTTGDDIVFNTAGTITFSTMPSSVSYNSLTISQGTVTLAHASGTTTRTLTLGGNAGTDFTIASGASLALGTNVGITLASNATADISGTLTINSSRTYNTDGTSVVTTVTGSIVNSGTVTCATASKLLMQSTSTYQHAQNSGAIPTATWNANSTCLVTGATTTVPTTTTFNQSFGNFTWNCASQTADLSLSGNLHTVNGTFTFAASNTGSLRLVGNSGNSTLAIAGNMVISGGELQLSGGSSTEGVTVAGNVSISGGTLDLASTSGGATWNVAGDFSHTAGTLTETGSSTTSTIVFNRSGTQTYTSGGTVSNTVNFTVNSGSTLQMAAEGTVVSGAGTFTLSSGAKLGITSTAGITSLGTASGNIRTTTGRNFNSLATYIYNGTGGAQVTGDGLPISVNGLTIGNSSGVTLTRGTQVDALTLSNGNLTTTTVNLLTMSSSISGGSASSFVNGPMTHSGSGTKFFPIGKGTAYRPVTLNILIASSPVVRAEVFNEGSGGTAGTGLTAISSVRYWFIPVTSGSVSSCTVELTYGSDDGVTDYNYLRVAQCTGSQGGTYNNAGGSGSGNGSGTISASVSDLRYFTLGNATDGTNPLPVELVSFTALAHTSSVELSWSTASEVNNYGFDVERNVVSLNDSWKKIGFVEGHGTSNTSHQYSFVDRGVTAGKYSYRLKQIDRDGKFKYYNQVEVAVSAPTAYSLEQNYPNPFNPSSTISFSLPSSGYVTLKVYNMLGQEVATLVNGKLEAGVHNAVWTPGELASGLYVYRLQASDGTHSFDATKKLMLMK